jgi:hypothetical protein
VPRPRTAAIDQRSDTFRVRITGCASLLLVVAFSTACGHREELDVMTMPAVCDSTLPPLPPGALAHVALPADVAASDSTGAIIGTVYERATARPMHAAASLLSAEVRETRAVVGPERSTDSLGGFAFRDVPPGRYTLRVRALNHYMRELGILVRAGHVDTVRLDMQFFSCRGY